MEKLAGKLARNISLSLGYDAEKESVIAYGLIAIIQIIITIILVAVLGLLVGAFVEALIVCFSASILRKYSGGAHAGSAELCTFFSVFYCTATAVISKKMLANIYNPIVMAIVLVIVFCFSLLTISKYAPVDSPNKPIRTEKKKSRMRKGSFIVLFAYYAISILFFILSYKDDSFRSYGISLIFGLCWQIFTLTHIGSLFIGIMNKLLGLEKEVQK